MRYRITFKDGTCCEVWADDLNEACRKGKMLGEIERIAPDYSSIFEGIVRTIRPEAL